MGAVAVTTDATPRRLVVRAEGITARQPDTEERIWGPAKSAPAAAVAGFAKKQNLEPEQLEIQNDGKAEKYTCLRKIEGQPATKILAEALPQLVLKTPFPKSMYWTEKEACASFAPSAGLWHCWMKRLSPSKSPASPPETNPLAIANSVHPASR